MDSAEGVSSRCRVQGRARQGHPIFNVLGDDPGCWGQDCGREFPELLSTLLDAASEEARSRTETQVIAGFPSETDDDFATTLDFVRDACFDSVVVFPYHDKPGTVSSELGDKVAEETIQRRMRAAFKYFRGHKIKAYYSCP